MRDRLEVIELPSYTAAEKVQIARRHLVPRQLEEHGLKRKLVRFPEATLRQVIQDYTREAGVRQLEREIAALDPQGRPQNRCTRKPASAADYHARPCWPVIWARRNLLPKLPSASTECGIAIGLAWTPVGGEILFIEATRMPGKGGLILTGSLGEVMKESAQTALSFLRNRAASLEDRSERL